jgi:hypothetical protein
MAPRKFVGAIRNNVAIKLWNYLIFAIRFADDLFMFFFQQPSSIVFAGVKVYRVAVDSSLLFPDRQLS